MTSLAAIRLLVPLAVRVDRRRLVLSALLMGMGYLATPLVALNLKLFTDAILRGEQRTAFALVGSLGLLIVAELMCAHFAHLSYYELSELCQSALNSRLFTAANDDVPLERREQPDYADMLHLAQTGLWRTTGAIEALLQFSGLVIQLLVSTVLIAGIHPGLALLPQLAPFLLVSGHLAEQFGKRAEQRAAESGRQARHLLKLAASPSGVVELRIARMEREVIGRYRQAREAAGNILWWGRLRAAVIRGLGQVLFSLGCIGALFLVFTQVAVGDATVGDFVLALALVIQVGTQVASGASLFGVLQRTGRTAEQFAWLSAQGENDARPRVPVRPGSGADGITLHEVFFTYPGRSIPAVREISVKIPAGNVVAIVGENGSGKSTLVKLLCGLYAPTSGRILLDDVPGDGRRGDGPWPVAAMFQDFARIELTLLESVGVGDLTRMSGMTVTEALGKGGAETLPGALPDGLLSIVGTRYAQGAELSGGQWQKLALARTFMRRSRLLVLDEPTAAFDPFAEHELVSVLTDAARDAAGSGGVTLVVSHRLSMARMADLVMVMDEGRLVAYGTHEELRAEGGLYADMIARQAHAYHED
ncbi:ABC transporter ATP-binding protein [Nonomuraea sp. MG754425]|uniref:ABC transporter ATP-binding protein n=1 Tax=Nonomuraea sp. MG754425 TaxID=2570319 RepID=UPI001F220275|nr:ABC transporter ATP-binding protein [Nonomuraea sp. MG754425]MCF6472391.1 ABC transporter ATP-binding protein [Nonomuraea sp. MG754425]